METQTISGEITRIIRFDSGYTVLTVSPNESVEGCTKWGVTLVGEMPSFVEGMVINATVEPIQHAKYGRQYKVHEIQECGFSTKDAIVDYLSSPIFKGIGQSTARKIVSVFGLDTLEILDKEPEKIADVPGFSKSKSDTFVSQWQEQRASHQTMAKLMGFGMTMGMASKSFHFFGANAVNIIEENPYALIKIPSIGFHKADDVALKMGIKRNSINRIKAAIEYTLDNVMWSNGHCFLFVGQVVAETTKLLSNDVNNDGILLALDEMEAELRIVKNDNRIYLTNIYFAEKRVVDTLKDMLDYQESPLYEKIEDMRLDIKEHTDLQIILAEEQEQAIFIAMNSRVSIITGGPGVGKTVGTKTICELLDFHKIDFKLCSPTGRAAKRLSEATGHSASTIHRLLGFQNGEFVYNSANPIPTRCVLVDEVSMVDILLFRALLDALEADTKLILVGDADQLPSVGPGNVLHDLIASELIPTTKLEKIFRQDKGSTIIEVAHDIIHGQVPELQSPGKSKGKNCMLVGASDIETLMNYVVDLVQTHIPKAGYGINDIQVLTPMRERGLGVNDFNPVLQKVLNPPAPNKPEVKAEFRILRMGDKVMHIRNDYEKDVFNGDVGFISGINKDGESPVIYVQYPDKNELIPYEQGDWPDIQLAFAATVHKSQGAEYPVVILIMHPSQYVMLQRNLLYTGLTRAKKLCIIAGTPEAIEVAVSNDKIQKRNTTLKERLQHAIVEK